MNLSIWVKRHVFRMDVPLEPQLKLSEETKLLNGAILDLTETLKEVNKRHGTEQVVDDALVAMNKAYRK